MFKLYSYFGWTFVRIICTNTYSINYQKSVYQVKGSED